MTTDTTCTGRRAATPARARRGAVASLFSAVLLLSAAPAFAQQATGAEALVDATSLRADSADAVAPTTRSALTDALSVSDRALLLATDLNRLLIPGAALAAREPASAGQMKTVLQRAMALLGTPYRWGGTSPDKGFDCSGLVGYVFRNAIGIELPRVSRDMAKTGQLINDRTQLTAGDLVFFGKRGTVDHVGIYVGEGRFVHAPSRGKDVTVSSMTEGYWSTKFLQARRVAGI